MSISKNSKEKYLYDDEYSSRKENEDSLEKFIKNLPRYRKDDIAEAGAIVLSSELFNNGHKYLVEYAAARVPHLYCFVADDFDSAIPFDDRMRLAKKSTDNINNITLIPGGKFAVSAKYYTSLYNQMMKKDKSVSASEKKNKLLYSAEDSISVAEHEITIFATRVAPVLGIKICFSGGEPVCGATHAYNSEMSNILSQHYIAFQMVPKTASSDAALIDKIVEGHLKKLQFEMIKEYVSPVTYLYMREKNEIPVTGYMMKLNEEQINFTLSIISDFKGNIFQYFLRKGINEIYIYGGGIISGRLSVMVNAIDSFRINSIIGSGKRKILNTKPYRLLLEFSEIDVITDNSIPVLVTESIEPDIYHKLKLRFPQIYFIDDICIHEYYVTCCMEPLLEITRAAGAELLLVNKTSIGENPSSYENWLKKTTRKSSRKTKSLNETIYENAYAPYGYDREYVKSCFIMKREKKYYDIEKTNYLLSPPPDGFDSGVTAVSDCAGPYVNCMDGIRHTNNLWPDATCNIYFLGHTVAFGLGADDNGTIESHLQNIIKKNWIDNDTKYNVLNCANSDKGDVYEIPRLLRRLPLKKGDIVICLLSYPWSVLKEYSHVVHICKTRSYFKRPHDLGEIFVDNLHMNSNGYKQYAVAIYDSLLKKEFIKKPDKNITEYRPYHEEPETRFEISDDSNNGYFISKPNFVIEEVDSVSVSASNESDEYLAQTKFEPAIQQTQIPNIEYDPNAASDPELFTYLVGLTQYRQGGVTQAGAVILTGGPFTYGHRHLVECVVSLMQHAYVFVAEDEKSVFPFEDRMRLIREGIRNIPNATVVPGGRFIISPKKAESQFDIHDKKNIFTGVEADIEIFARYIATALNITAFFTGERSPDDSTVRRYDLLMQNILPSFGVEYKTIPRREYSGKPISATWVRSLLREQRFSEIERLAPPSTITYLRDMYELPSWQVKKK